jgi:SagB-type dehydrogenase family enzyme
MLAAVDGEGHIMEEESAALEAWEFHDLLFHARSRRGRSDGGFGSTFRLAHRPPPPALEPRDEGEAVELFAPDPAVLERDDLPFARIQNSRRSIREYGGAPISARDVGEFLFRVARVTECWKADFPTPAGPVSMEFASRPYPGAGALYELDLYVVVQRCRDLAPGLYRYDPLRHRLDPIAAATADVQLLLAEAAASAGMAPDSLQLLIVLAARFERVAWKYESIAYSLVLKNTGALFQTMYLAATAMGLAPCALGCGDSDLFARAAGTDYYVKTSVGEFLLGSKV